MSDELRIEVLPRRYSVVAAVLGSAWLLFAGQYLVLGRWFTATLDLVVAGLIVIALLVARATPSRHRVAGHAMLGASTVGLFVASILSGQSEALAVWFLPFIPVASLFLLGGRAVVFWAAAAGIAIVGVHASSVWLPVEPEFLASGVEVIAAQLCLLAVAALVGGAAQSDVKRDFEKVQSYVSTVEKARDYAHSSNLLLRAVVDQLPSGMLLASPEGEVLLVSNSFCEVFDLSEAAIAGLHLDKLWRNYLERQLAEGNDLEDLVGNPFDAVVRRELAVADGRIIQLTITRLGTDDGSTAGLVVEVVDVSARAQREQALVEALNRDELTGLSSRKYLAAKLEELCERDGGPFAVLMLDLDEFKPVNDKYGHGTGDLLLKELAERMRKTVRSSDLVARIGGDEFAVVLPGADLDKQPVHTIKKLLQSLSEEVSVAGKKLRVSASLGCAFFPTHGRTPAELLRAADAAMYDAKEAGRNRYTVSGTNGTRGSKRAKA